MEWALMQFLADSKLSEENAESPHEGSDGVSCSRDHNSLLICGHGVAVRVWSSLFFVHTGARTRTGRRSSEPN